METKLKNISVFQISQATTATFIDLYFQLTCLIFIQNGSKTILDSQGNRITGQKNDLFIFPAGSLVTIQNRAKLDQGYLAIGISFHNEKIHRIFGKSKVSDHHSTEIQLVENGKHSNDVILSILIDTIKNKNHLPPEILENRLIEPLIWLKQLGFFISTQDENLWSQIKNLIGTDLMRNWNSRDVAQYFAMSEATMRRRLAKSKIGFAKILLNTRLENGLFLLQTTDMQIIEIALECGFKSSSHFSETFKKRFNITPKEIRKLKK